MGDILKGFVIDSNPIYIIFASQDDYIIMNRKNFLGNKNKKLIEANISRLFNLEVDEHITIGNNKIVCYLMDEEK